MDHVSSRLKSGIKEVSINAHQASNECSLFNKGLSISDDPHISTSFVVALQMLLLILSWSGYGQSKVRRRMWRLEIKLG
ncbi:hypothetical protein F8388_019920 [Cannabis sativa]|uniref:Uncharacterized protein n=1 Tax=Cannabis sativa TaxID=3483 RepID=A0A7J6EVE8_CANSA|nr:hypothetical protein G4B88_015292 [Cannabis sativa]KAF4390265.1 hypothetical protein F8388_019920 [Cannabis sativa]